MGRFNSLRRPMGGFMPPEPELAPAESGGEGVAEALHRIEIIGRFLIRQVRQLERQMDARNYSTQEILDAVRAQRGEIASMSALLGGIKARLNAALAGEISPKGQAILNDIMSEIQGNSRALTTAQLNNDDDPSNDVDPETGKPLNQPQPGGVDQPPANQPGSAGGIKEPAETGKAATSTTLSTSKAVVNVGEQVTLTASVSAANGSDKPITGRVTFATEGGDIGRAALDSTGVAAMSTSVPAGDHSLTATYEGDDNFASSTSEAITQSAIASDQTQVDPAAQGTQTGAGTAANPGTDVGNNNPNQGGNPNVASQQQG